MKNAVTEKLISKLAKTAKPKLTEKDKSFLRSYYLRLSADDFAANSTSNLQKIAQRHLDLGKTRQRGITLMDIFNSGDEQNGEIASTVINIITDDKPFLINSLTITLNRLNKTILRTTHPAFDIERDKNDRIRSIARHDESSITSEKPESYIQFQIEYTSPENHANLEAELNKAINDVNMAVADWPSISNHVHSISNEIERNWNDPASSENASLLRWLDNHHFAMLGYCEVQISGKDKKFSAKLIKDSQLGFIRCLSDRGVNVVKDFLPPLNCVDTQLSITKSKQRSTIHRSNFLDCVLIRSDLSGRPKGKSKSSKTKPLTISCLVGFNAGSSSILPTTEIPLLREKTDTILKQSKLRKGGFAYKSLRNIMETLPREKLFQMDLPSLQSLSVDILNQQERRQTRLHLHRDSCGHFYSCLVYVPRDLFNSSLRLKIQNYLAEQLNASEVTFDIYFSYSILTRIHFIAHVKNDTEAKINLRKLEQHIEFIGRDWNENLYEVIAHNSSHQHANEILNDYRDAFPASYKDDMDVENAAKDIEKINKTEVGSINTSLYQTETNLNSSNAYLKIYSPGQNFALSDVLPILENMGVRVLGEHVYKIHRNLNGCAWIHEFEISRTDASLFDIERDSDNFRETFYRAWHDEIENDGYNQLTLLANLDWREVNLLRAYFRYLKQIRLRYSERYVIDALANNPTLVTLVRDLFDSLFNPEGKNSIRKIKSTIKKELDKVNSLDEDRIISALVDVVQATLRNNYYQVDQDGNHKSYLSIKLDSRSIPRIPEPTPQFEIFVYSPRVEGVHLRGGPIARGGLRWSERPEDFRTEVLGLVKAQRVKNAVIVPVGSKGGFVAKQLPDSNREAIQNEVIHCYQLFIRGLLDLTDNLKGTQVIPPNNIVRRDEDDPYLVVAADKGTATFSDIANSLSEEYGFWLGDAFASGGSVGYDHKKMGITARGAWESVKRHFRELGKDIQNQDFTAVGIGDMAGDVFGNGMLLSKHIQLVAAFNHQHIFIDPTPDSASTYKERERLFNLPRSSWADYNTKLISKGGAIFERSAKSITLSSEAKKALNATRDTYSPNDLISVILKSEVELLWNGGIGTYVKASFETHEDAQDKNNDSLRVDANELRCKVIGEGGNLGMTQFSRIEYSQHGGLCYTDAIDNSAGVDTSDHEVNIKILLNSAIEKGLISGKQRNTLLAKMEDEVGHLVLRNNYIQTQILSIITTYSADWIPSQIRGIQLLEQKGLLNRRLEFLPDEDSLKELATSHKGLTRPELAVLLSYGKMDFYTEILESDLPDDPYISIEIEKYFPKLMSKKFNKLVHKHRLGREIKSTHITNTLIGRLGPVFHLRVGELTGAGVGEIARAAIASRDILNITDLNYKIEALDNKIPAALQMDCLKQTALTMEQSVIWLLRNRTSPIKLAPTVKHFAKQSATLQAKLDSALSEKASNRMIAHATRMEKDGIPATVAKRLATLPFLEFSLDIIDTAIESGNSVIDAAQAYFQLSDYLQLDWVSDCIQKLPIGNDWHERARFTLKDDLRSCHSSITAKILSSKPSSKNDIFTSWSTQNSALLADIKLMVKNLKDESSMDFAMLSVFISELSRLK